MRRTGIGLVAAALCLVRIGMAADTFEAPLAVRETTEAVFTAKPTAVPDGDNVKITFAVSAATDVEVAILNAKGALVRHLVAGLLGKHAPKPLQKNSLRQELIWDRRDDLGQPVKGGPFTVRVRLGARPRLEKILGWDGNTLDPIRSLAVSDKGELYVLLGSWVSRGRTELRVFNRSGTYLRTIMPYPATTPPERTKSVGHLMIEGERVPVVFSGHAHSLHPLTTGLKRQTMAWNPKGHLVVTSTLATAFEHGLPRHLLAFHPQGGAPDGMRFVGPELRPPTGIMWGHGEGDDPCLDHVAVSPDGKYIYYTTATYASRHAVFRLHWAEDNGSGMEAAFIGEDYRPGHDDSHLNDPQGLATDPKGNLYVCDRGNNRVMIYSPKGDALGSFAVKNPELIAVHPKTGTIYIASRQRRWGGPPKDIGPLSMGEYKRWRARDAERKQRRPKPEPPALLKFSAWAKDKAPKQLARLDQGVDLIALDPTADPPRLWASVRYRLMPITDRGGEFEVGEHIGNANGLVYPGYIVADPKRNRALVYGLSTKYKVRSVDLTTGRRRTFLSDVSEVALAPDGSIYATGKYSSHTLHRFGADGKPLPFEGSDSNQVRTVKFTSRGLGLGQRGLAVGPNGDIYLMRNWQERAIASRVDVFGPDGKLKRAALIDGMGIGDCGIDVDPAGNVYIGANVKRRDRLYQDAFTGKVPPTTWLCWAQWTWHYRPAPWYYSMRNEYLYHWGSVFKFGPEGGAFYGRGSKFYGSNRNASSVASVENAPADAPEYASGYLYHQVKAVGAKWRYSGMGIVPASERYWGDPSCVCLTSRLAVDGFGRVFAPNCFRFCVEMLDTNGNQIARVGRYGNANDTGPDIHFAWPAFVDVADGTLYVSDSVNRRITVVRFDHAAEAGCRVP